MVCNTRFLRQSNLNPCTELAVVGIGVHHAGLNMDDRRLTEELYLNGTLRVVVATSVCYDLFARRTYSLLMFRGRIDPSCRRELA